jgi:hypothetical protein
MKRTVTPEALKLTSELMQQGGQTRWRICDEYQIRGREIIARYSPPWIVAPDSPPLDRRRRVALEELRSSRGDTRPVPKVSSLASRAKFREGGTHLQPYLWSAGRQQHDGKLPEAIQTIQR